MSNLEAFLAVNPVGHVHVTDSVVFTFEGEPASKERPRFNPKTGHAYTPAKTRQMEARIAEIYLFEVGQKFLGPIEMKIYFYLGTRRQRDIDNMAKLVMDSLNGVAYDDDKQVYALTVVKGYTVKERARTSVQITQMTTADTESDVRNLLP